MPACAVPSTVAYATVTRVEGVGVSVTAKEAVAPAGPSETDESLTQSPGGVTVSKAPRSSCRSTGRAWPEVGATYSDTGVADTVLPLPSTAVAPANPSFSAGDVVVRL